MVWLLLITPYTMHLCPLNLIASGVASFTRALPTPTLNRRRLSPATVASPHGYLPAILAQIDWCHHLITSRSIGLRLTVDPRASLSAAVTSDLNVDLGLAMLIGGHVMRSLVSDDNRTLALDPLVEHFQAVRSQYVQHQLAPASDVGLGRAAL